MGATASGVGAEDQCQGFVAVGVTQVVRGEGLLGLGTTNVLPKSGVKCLRAMCFLYVPFSYVLPAFPTPGVGMEGELPRGGDPGTIHRGED